MTADKAIAAAITSVVGLIAFWWPPVSDYASPQVVSTIAMVAAPILVYLIPNRPKA
jgi:purine-cytosine permease-like protein